MAIYIPQPMRTPQPGMPGCQPLPVCPACGGLECLCRPRFFAGQLLTEETLNDLERYIVEKNKLHNRYLHGWGVVCGLEVVCHPCQDQVTVRAGYALSPCGDDIVVCRDAPVDVCALTQACRDWERRHPECDPPRPGGSEECRDVTEEWVLAICYDEKPSRGITALRAASGSACCSRCSGSGSPACGCGCHGQTNGHGSHNQPRVQPTQRRTPAQCEPILTCEGYVFRVYRAPTPTRNEPRRPGALLARFEACIRGFIQRLTPFPTAETTPARLYEWCCWFKETLRDLLMSEGTYDCLLGERIGRIMCPNPTRFDSPDAYRQEWLRVFQEELLPVAAEFFRYCLCSALLPPCPEPVEDNCVPLATLTVRRTDCRVVQVCNWGPRRFAVTFPNLGYWLSWLPLLQQLRDAIERVCCRPFVRRDQAVGLNPQPTTPPPPPPPPPPPGGVGRPAATAPEGGISMTMRPEQEFFTLFEEMWGNRGRGIDAQTLLLGALGASNIAGAPYMQPHEMRNPVPFLLLNQVATPLIANMLPDEVSRLLDFAAASGFGLAGEAAPATADELASLRRMVEELQTTVRQQQATIDELRRRRR
jgi:hypothetical protein